MASERLNAKSSPQTAYFRFETGRDQDAGNSPIPRWLAWAYGYDDQSSSVVTFDVPRNVIIEKVIHQVATAFTGATAITIGDGDADDGWIAGATITPGSAGDTVSDPDSTNHAIGAKFYQTGGQLKAVFTGVATAGTGKLFAKIISYAEPLAST